MNQREAAEPERVHSTEHHLWGRPGRGPDELKGPITVGQIIVSENMTLDGVVQDPTGEEGLPSGGWFGRTTDADRAAWAALSLEEARSATALLLGRRTDAYFAERWPSRTGEWADRLNRMPKYVVSSTLSEARWSGATIIDGDVVAEISALKDALDGEIVLYASAQLAHTLTAHDLIDAYRLTIYPCVLGEGKRLFPAGAPA